MAQGFRISSLEVMEASWIEVVPGFMSRVQLMRIFAF